MLGLFCRVKINDLEQQKDRRFMISFVLLLFHRLLENYFVLIGLEVFFAEQTVEFQFYNPEHGFSKNGTVHF